MGVQVPPPTPALSSLKAGAKRQRWERGELLVIGLSSEHTFVVGDG